MIGQTISHYRITEKLGEGGMGVVYKAEDTKLRRTVALKFLRADVIEDPEHRERFLREAQAAAALDHPNICTVYEIDEVNGQTFLSMAFLAGQTVKQKLKERPLKLAEALDIAGQTAQGLRAAHGKDIVHRDIKSANLMVSTEGHVRIMDFGLARLADRSQLTKTDARLGTPAYMSPEQVRGKDADQRSDIWSLGVVLHQMISGRLPFPGEAEAAVTYGILNEQPEPVTALRSGVPIELDRILDKALAKSPEERYQHVDEMLVDLRAIQTSEAQPTRDGRRSASPPAGAKGSPPAKFRSKLIWAGVSAAITAAVVLGLARLDPLPDSAPLVRLQLQYKEPGGLDGGSAPACSPDGLKVAFVAANPAGRSLLWVRSVDSLSAQPLEGTDGARHPFWSPDSRSIAFFADGRLKKIDVSRGTVLTVCEAGLGRGGAWNQDGDIVFGPSYRAGLYLVPASGGEATPLTNLDPSRNENSHRWPDFLPDGRRFLYTARSAEESRICVGSLDSQERRCLFPARSSARYSRSRRGGQGYLLYVEEGTLLARNFDAASLETAGTPFAVASNVAHVPSSSSARFAVSANGRLLAHESGPAGETQLTWIDRAGNQIEQVGDPAFQLGLRLSPGGDQVALVQRGPANGQPDIWLMNLARGIRIRLTSSGSQEYAATWSPDGKFIVFHSDRSGVDGIYRMRTSGEGTAELLVEDAHQASDWSADGKLIVFARRTDDTGATDLWVTSPLGEHSPKPLMQTAFDETDAHFSPDGGWLAYSSNESGNYEVYIRPVSQEGLQTNPGRGARTRVSQTGGASARWRRDGREFFYLTPDGALVAVKVSGDGAMDVSKPQHLFNTCITWLPTQYWESVYDVSADGERFLFNCPVDENSRLTLEINWETELFERSGAG